MTHVILDSDRNTCYDVVVVVVVFSNLLRFVNVAMSFSLALKLYAALFFSLLSCFCTLLGTLRSPVCFSGATSRSGQKMQGQWGSIAVCVTGGVVDGVSGTPQDPDGSGCLSRDRPGGEG